LLFPKNWVALVFLLDILPDTILAVGEEVTQPVDEILVTIPTTNDVLTMDEKGNCYLFSCYKSNNI